MKLMCPTAHVLVFIHLFAVLPCDNFGYQDIIFVILSQGDPLHEERALNLESSLKFQTHNMSLVYLTHRDLNHVGDWTVLPLLERLSALHDQKFQWIIFCDDRTKLNVTNLKLSAQENNVSSTFFGMAIRDSEPTIIHHFASLPEFSYPLFASGFAMNYKLFYRLMIETQKTMLKKVDFSIDASHELALFIRNNLNGTLLVNNSQFCLNYKEGCATYVDNNDMCERLTDIKKIFFAVKTCKKFHATRISVVKATWAKDCHYIQYFSNSADENIPTYKINVQNTKSGHCVKTQAIFTILRKYFIENVDLEWCVLADDDTLLRIQKLVSCYDSTKPYVLGERYGYNVYSANGYNYITGGGGALLSRAALMKISNGLCECPSVSTPDDMFLLGICLQRLNITLVHVPLFHQARPNDYADEYLHIGKPISFHKHWMTDPVQIYKEWLNNNNFHNDELLYDKPVHAEL